MCLVETCPEPGLNVNEAMKWEPRSRMVANGYSSGGKRTLSFRGKLNVTEHKACCVLSHHQQRCRQAGRLASVLLTNAMKGENEAEDKRDALRPPSGRARTCAGNASGRKGVVEVVVMVAAVLADS